MTNTRTNAPSQLRKPSLPIGGEPQRRSKRSPASLPVASKTPLERGVKAALSGQTVPETPPAMIAANEKNLATWQEANEDERLIAIALWDLGVQIQSDGIKSFFLFGDFWNARYPREDGKAYAYGMNAVKKGASMSPYGASQVYTILKTISIYPRLYYEELYEKAASNGVILSWTNLRTIASRLGKNEWRTVRRTVENHLVSRDMTTKQLNRLIDELAPQTIKAIKVSDEIRQAQTRFTSFVSSLKRNSYTELLHAITQCEDGFQGDDPKEVKKTLTQTRAALQELDRMKTFIQEVQPILQALCEQVAFFAENDPDTLEQKTAQIAGTVKERVASDQRQAQARRQTQADRIKLRGEFSDDDEFDQTPRTVLRDGDEYRPRASAGDDEYADVEGNDEESDDWEEIDEMDESIFTEMGEIPDDDHVPVRRRR